MQADFRNLRPFVVSFALSAFILFVFLRGGQRTSALWMESGLVENFSAIGYVFAMVFFYQVARQAPSRVRIWAVFWLILSFLCCGEETSWLQHFIGYQTPHDVAEINRQEEFNLHNLDMFQSEKLIGDVVDRSWTNFLSIQLLFQFGFFSYFFLLPTICLLPVAQRIASACGLVVPGWRLVACLWLPIGLSAILTLLSAHDADTKSAVAEIREMFFALGFASYGYVMARKFRTRR